MDQPKVILSEQPWQYCDCGGTVFEEKMMFKYVSGLLVGKQEAQHVPVPVLICHSCSKIPSFIHKSIPGTPDDMKAKPKLNLDQGITSPGTGQ